MINIGMEYSNQQLFEELRSIVIRERIKDIYQYKELVENLIEEKRSYGFFDDDENLPQVVKDLMLRWPEMEEMLIRNEII
jgi:hypothetical protein